MNITGVDHIVLLTPDVERALKFYCDGRQQAGAPFVRLIIRESIRDSRAISQEEKS